jgi:hypothetical protein
MTMKKHAVIEIPGISGFSSHLGLFGMKQYELRQLGISVLHFVTWFFEDRLEVFEKNIKGDEWPQSSS